MAREGQGYISVLIARQDDDDEMSSILDIEHSPYYIAFGLTQTYKAINDREEWRKKVRDIRAGGMT